MNIVANSLKNYKVALTMLLIVIASIWFALNSQPTQPAQPVKVVVPDLIIMRRESEPSRLILVNLPNGNTLVWEI